MKEWCSGEKEVLGRDLRDLSHSHSSLCVCVWGGGGGGERGGGITNCEDPERDLTYHNT